MNKEKYSEHLVTIFRKIDPSKRYDQFTYHEESSFEAAYFGAKAGDIFLIDGEFYQVSIREVLSSKERIENLIVKSGRRIIKKIFTNK